MGNSDSIQKKEFKSIFTTSRNANFFQESQDIEIFEGKKPFNETFNEEVYLDKLYK